jgi:V8-like Glu-specific endopeptidase
MAQMDPQRRDKTKCPQVGMILSSFTGDTVPYRVGTGTLIQKRAILTAAHMVFDPTLGGRPKQFEVFFGNGDHKTAAGTNGRFLEEWETEKPGNPLSGYDLGVILLDVTNTVSSMTPADFSVSSLNADLLNRSIEFVGYPTQPNFYFNRVLAGGESLPVDNMGSPYNAYRVAYLFASLFGMSGGPVYRPDETSTVINIRAVNTSIYKGMGNGLIISSALGEWIDTWLGEVS